MPRLMGPSSLALIVGLFTLGPAQAASGLLAHRASYQLTLDAAKSSQRLDSAKSRIDYEIRGDACEGYAVKMSQSSTLDTGEGDPVRSDLASTSWEEGHGKSYRFKTQERLDGDTKTNVDAEATRGDDGQLTVKVAKPDPRTVRLPGKILLPTEHVVKVLAAAAAGDSLLEAKVYDGSTDGTKVYNTLAVIGSPSTDAGRLAPAAKEALTGHTFYPVNVSYYDAGKADGAPEYTMSFTLYDNGVIGDLKIDYGDFALRGALDTFEVLKSAASCDAK